VGEFARTGPAQVNEYRAYVMSADGHIIDRIDLLCADDDEAKERAKQLVDGHDIELWQLDRKIAEFKAPE
jgi:hypothetical protein